MQGLVTVFGGSGFVGSQIVRALAKSGARVRVAVRNPGRGYRLRMLGDVGQIEVSQANIRDEASVARALEGAHACVNAVGVLFESGRQTFGDLHAQGAGLLGRVGGRGGRGPVHPDFRNRRRRRQHRRLRSLQGGGRGGRARSGPVRHHPAALGRVRP